MGSGYSKMKKQAKQFQEQMAKMQEEMENLEVVGSAGNGLVKITMSGDKQVKKVEINPECVDPEDIEGLQDLILSACNDASAQLEKNAPESPLGNLPF